MASGFSQVLRFPEGNGLSLATTGLVNPTNNSVVVVFRLANTHGYRRILDFAGGVSDTGLYNLDGRVALYGADSSSKNVVLNNSYAEIALTNAAVGGGSEQVTAYLNGTEVAAGKASSGFDLGSGQLRFFRDNTSGAFPGEESSGAVSCVLVYDGTLTADEVSQVADDPTLCPAPRPAPGRAQASVTGEPRAIRSRGSTHGRHRPDRELPDRHDTLPGGRPRQCRFDSSDGEAGRAPGRGQVHGPRRREQERASAIDEAGSKGPARCRSAEGQGLGGDQGK